MAVPTGPGTETIQSHMFEEMDSVSGGPQNLINGVQHHTYTVISIVVHCNALQATTNKFTCAMIGWEGHGGASQQEIKIFEQVIPAGETFVWSDRFSFFGHEPSGAGVFDTDLADQTNLPAQGGTAVQRLYCYTTNAADDYDLVVTYLDQDWT